MKKKDRGKGDDLPFEIEVEAGLDAVDDLLKPEDLDKDPVRTGLWRDLPIDEQEEGLVCG